MATIFTTIQFMKFYLHTAYSISATFYGTDSSNTPFKVSAKVMGLAQLFD